MKKLALVAVGYNRVKSMQRLLESLERAGYAGDTIELYISLDKAKTNDVVDLANTFKWTHGEKHVLTYPERLGLRNHILKCGDLLENYDAIAIFEDDIVASDGFYNYMKQSVDFYYEDNNIAGISLYSNTWNEFACAPFIPDHSEYDTYYFQFAESRGQIWLKNQWKSFKDWYLEHQDEALKSENIPSSMCQWPSSSWKKYHVKYCVDNNKYFVYPYISLATCYSDIGTHNRRTDTFIQVALHHGSKKNYIFPKNEDTSAVFYDVFYERKKISGYDECCVDLYGIKKWYEGKRFLISSEHLPYRILKKFGAQLKPQEANIQCNVEGVSFYLYDTNVPAKVIKYKNLVTLFRYRFDVYDHTKVLLLCALQSCKERMVAIFKKLFK